MENDRQLGVLWGVVGLLCLLLSPWAAHLAEVAPACPLKSVSGIPCPSCGTSRSAVLLARLELVEALVRYPLQTLAWLGFVGSGMLAGIWSLAGRSLPSLPRRLPGWAVVGVVAAFLLNWAYCIVTGV